MGSGRRSLGHPPSGASDQWGRASEGCAHASSSYYAPGLCLSPLDSSLADRCCTPVPLLCPASVLGGTERLSGVWWLALYPCWCR